MKAHFASVIFGLMLGLISLNVNAQLNFYVTSGEEFKLKPTGPLGAILENIETYRWKVDGSDDGLSDLIGESGVLTQTITLANATVPETRTYTLDLVSSIAGCVSSLVTYTVHVLPVLTGTLAQSTQICNDVTDIAVQLTAGTIANLPEGISIKYIWTKVGESEALTAVTGSPEKLDVTSVGQYVASASYQLTGIATTLTKLTSAAGTFTTTVSKLAAVVTPELSLE